MPIKLNENSTDLSLTRNQWVIVISTFFTKLGDLLLNPKVTLVALVQQLGGNSLAVSMIVPIRESMSMIPQVALAPLLNKHSRYLLMYRVGAILQAVSVLAIALVALLVDGALAVWGILALLLSFSVARCLCSLTSKAILGEAVEKGERGLTTGAASTVAGCASILIAAGFLALESVNTFHIGIMLLLASVTWVVAATLYGMIQTEIEGTRSDQSRSFLQRIKKLARDDKTFQKFIVVRALLLSTALLGPYFVVLAGGLSGGISKFAVLLMAAGLASLLSSAVWGRFSDRSSNSVLALAATIAAAVSVLVVVGVLTVPELVEEYYLIPVAYFILAIAHQGVRIGRKTYVVDIANNDNRVDYVAVSNTCIGILILLVGGIIGLVGFVLPTTGIVLLLSALGAAGAYFALRLPGV